MQPAIARIHRELEELEAWKRDHHEAMLALELDAIYNQIHGAWDYYRKTIERLEAVSIDYAGKGLGNIALDCLKTIEEFEFPTKAGGVLDLWLQLAEANGYFGFEFSSREDVREFRRELSWWTNPDPMVSEMLDAAFPNGVENP